MYHIVLSDYEMMTAYHSLQSVLCIILDMTSLHAIKCYVIEGEEGQVVQARCAAYEHVAVVTVRFTRLCCTEIEHGHEKSVFILIDPYRCIICYTYRHTYVN